MRNRSKSLSYDTRVSSIAVHMTAWTGDSSIGNVCKSLSHEGNRVSVLSFCRACFVGASHCQDVVSLVLGKLHRAPKSFRVTGVHKLSADPVIFLFPSRLLHSIGPGVVLPRLRHDLDIRKIRLKAFTKDSSITKMVPSKICSCRRNTRHDAVLRKCMNIRAYQPAISVHGILTTPPISLIDSN